jgi:gas vesicle protein
VKRGVGTVGDTVSSASQKARETAHDLRDHVAGAAGQVRQTATNVGDTLKEYSGAVGEQVSALGEQVAETADRTRQQASRAARQVKEKASSAIYEQPLLFAAIGLAVGAAIAAALPSTKTEDEWMGDASDSVKDAATEAASSQFEAAKAAAGNVLQEAKGAIEKEGLMPSAAAEVARNVGDKIKRVVADTATAGKTEMRDFAKMGDKG